MHSEECSQVHGCQAVALVEATYQDYTYAKCAQNWGWVKAENGMKKLLAYFFTYQMILDILRV